MLQERINQWVEAYDRNGYLYGSLLVAYRGDIIVNKGFGLANQEHQVPNTPATKYRIGSLTKAFTAMSIFQLHEKKKLHLNDPVDKYLPGYPNGGRMTIYHCLTNTAGIPNYTSFPDFWPHTMRLPSTLGEVIDSFKAHELDFEPGSRFGYSNSGYALLTAIIESVSGMSYAEYIGERICLPLGMAHTGCDDGVRLVPGLASGYTYYEEPIHAAFADLSFPLGAYGMYATTEDLLIWDASLTASRLISSNLTEKMFAPHLGSYACGWSVSKLDGRACFHHFGDISGYCNHFFRFVDDQVTIIFLSNMNVVPVTHLGREIAKTLFGEETPLPPPAEPVQSANCHSLTGRYTADDAMATVLDISLKNNELYLTVPKMYGIPYKFKLVPVSRDSTKIIYMTRMINEQLVFRYSASGEIEYVDYTDYFGQSHMLYKDTLSLN